MINQFKQIFNARSQMNRLRENGYPDAFVLETGEPLYYVVAATTDDSEEAKKTYLKIQKDKSVVIRSPFPWLLIPATFPMK
ncbi:MAG: hypothetical protein K2L31_05710 [Muribaculum sp.]|nr:hypothetical protein [Muribaculum sp.]